MKDVTYCRFFDYSPIDNIINMTNKIQISTVHKEADVQVIELNAQFIARIVESEILAKDIMADITNFEDSCDEEATRAEIAAPTLAYWRMDLEKVWSLLNNVKQAFLCEERVEPVSVHLPTTSPSI